MEPSLLPLKTGKAITEASQSLIVRLLGPAVDVWGEHFRQWNLNLLEQRAKNVNRVLKAADQMLDGKSEDLGSIHPRVLKEILDDGSFVEDELGANYFGGVLASSLTGVDRDDRGASLAKIVAELSVYDIRLHFVIYREFKRAFDGSDLNVGKESDCKKMELFFPFQPLASAMELSQQEFDAGVIGSAMGGLHRRWLIGQGYAFGYVRQSGHKWASDEDFGLVVHPSAFGASLYMWVHGQGSKNQNGFTSSEVKLDSYVEVPEMVDIKITKELPLLPDQIQISETID